MNVPEEYNLREILNSKENWLAFVSAIVKIGNELLKKSRRKKTKGRS